MIGYGDEDKNFVLELTYNYNVQSYEAGNDFNYIKISSNEVFKNIKESNAHPFTQTDDDLIETRDPNGYRFLITNNQNHLDQITSVSLFATDLKESVHFWKDLLKSNLLNQTETSATFNFSELDYFTLNLQKSTDSTINHAKAYGRIAFSCPLNDQEQLQSDIDNFNKELVLVRLVVLPTPGKADVRVVILGDTDKHEICFVDDEGFRELSKTIPDSQKALYENIQSDKTDKSRNL
jgi:catechol 2,3-dioxygenase-like lactoylglutathione lyase family enzyme